MDVSDQLKVTGAVSPVSRLRSRAALRWLLLVMIVLAPAIVTFLLLSVRLHVQLTNFVPQWSDEISYWHQVLTFKTVGFNGGYYAIYEVPPAASFTHFYTHGPWYPMIYGTLGAILGWNFYSPVVINLLLVGLALGGFAGVARLDERGLLVTLLHVLTFWPLLLYLTSAMQESLQQVEAVGLALIFYILLVIGKTLTWRWQGLFTLLIVFASITRMDWAILLLPFFLLTARRTPLGILFAVVKTVIAGIIVVLIVDYVGAPGNNSIFALFQNFTISFEYGLHELQAHFAKNWAMYSNPNKAPLDWLLTLEVFGLVVLSAGMVVYGLARRRGRWAVEGGIHAYNLIGIVLASLLLYLIGTGGDYRVIAVHIMVSIMLLIACKRYWIVALFIAANLVCLPYFLANYDDFTAPKFHQSRRVLEKFGDVARQYIAYEPDAPSPWCNTVLFRIYNYVPELLELPGGIGQTTYYNADDPKLSYKSQYLWISDDDYGLIQARPNPPHLELLTTTANGSFYRNLDSDCG